MHRRHRHRYHHQWLIRIHLLHYHSIVHLRGRIARLCRPHTILLLHRHHLQIRTIDMPHMDICPQFAKCPLVLPWNTRLPFRQSQCPPNLQHRQCFIGGHQLRLALIGQGGCLLLLQRRQCRSQGYGRESSILLPPSRTLGNGGLKYAA